MLEKLVKDYVESHKRINRPVANLESHIKVILETVENINSAGELDKRIGGELLNEIFVPSWVKPFVFPKKVSLFPGFQYKDMVARPAKDPDWVYDGAKVAYAANMVAQYFKCTARLVSAETLRGSELVPSQVSFSVDGQVERKGNELFYPVPLIPDLAAVLGDVWFNETEDKMVELFFARSFDMTTDTGKAEKPDGKA